MKESDETLDSSIDYSRRDRDKRRSASSGAKEKPDYAKQSTDEEVVKRDNHNKIEESKKQQIDLEEMRTKMEAEIRAQYEEEKQKQA